MSDLACGSDWMFAQRKEMAAQIATGFAQAERGELIDEDATREMLRQRRAERPPSSTPSAAA
jgi:predicted transcriptional regulator